MSVFIQILYGVLCGVSVYDIYSLFWPRITVNLIMWKTGQSYTKVIQGLKPSILFDDCPRLMIIRQYFVAWRVLISGLRVSHLDYLELPWVCRVRDIHIWVCESDSSVLLEYIHCKLKYYEFLSIKFLEVAMLRSDFWNKDDIFTLII